MAIVKVDPEDWKTSNTVQLDSDAPSNREALLEIDEWAAEHGFARVNEHWLRRIITQDRCWLFRGVCYRLTPEEQTSAQAAGRAAADARGKMPTASRRVDDDR
ncbi:MAG TPA: hypothetical protein VM243_21385 [Phycisphaerae bacterium]|nr:hypothetical protein [Phycisphaerae bacterium]